MAMEEAENPEWMVKMSGTGHSRCLEFLPNGVSATRTLAILSMPISPTAIFSGREIQLDDRMSVSAPPYSSTRQSLGWNFHIFSPVVFYWINGLADEKKNPRCSTQRRLPKRLTKICNYAIKEPLTLTL